MVWEIALILGILVLAELVALFVIAGRKVRLGNEEREFKKQHAEDAQSVKAMLFNDNAQINVNNISNKEPEKKTDFDVQELIRDINDMAKGDVKTDARYLGSKKTMKYHLASCKLARNTFPEHRIENNSIDYFKKNKFKACKRCMKK